MSEIDLYVCVCSTGKGRATAKNETNYCEPRCLIVPHVVIFSLERKYDFFLLSLCRLILFFFKFYNRMEFNKFAFGFDVVQISYA